MGLSLREEISEEALVEDLLWWGGNFWQCLCRNILEMGSLGKQ